MEVDVDSSKKDPLQDGTVHKMVGAASSKQAISKIRIAFLFLFFSL